MDFPIEKLEQELLIIKKSLLSINEKKEFLEFDGFSVSLNHNNQELLKRLSENLKKLNYSLEKNTLRIILID